MPNRGLPNNKDHFRRESCLKQQQISDLERSLNTSRSYIISDFASIEVRSIKGHLTTHADQTLSKDLGAIKRQLSLMNIDHKPD